MAEKFSVIIPAYNEEKAIGQIINDLNKVMSKTGAAYEIIVVDDNSSDGTNSIALSKGVTVLQ